MSLFFTRKPVTKYTPNYFPKESGDYEHEMNVLNNLAKLMNKYDSEKRIFRKKELFNRMTFEAGVFLLPHSFYTHAKKFGIDFRTSKIKRRRQMLINIGVLEDKLNKRNKKFKKF